MRLSGKTAFITGGNSGIGLATAQLFVAEGARIAITGRNRDTLAAAVKTIGAGSHAFVADVQDFEATRLAVDEAAAALGGLDVVFANAGIAGDTPLGGTDPAAFEAVLRTNVTGVFFTLQAALPHLRDGGSLILNGSVHEVLGVPGYSAYAASKAGVRAMARCLASELAPRGIRVNVVVPGATRTPIWGRIAPEADARTALEASIVQHIPLGHLGEAEDVARAALFLASDDARNVTASELVVDGGTIGAPAGAPAHRR
ncbi:MAG: SDR family oxidoreductase [bacterium]|nr:SDR family oxidoreductase [bacterium]